MEILKIKEGDIEISIPENEKLSGKIPFFNPVMKFNRDFTIAIFKVKRFLDGLSACGALSIRLKKEAEDIEIHSNEISNETLKFLRQNKEDNNADIIIHNRDLNLLLNEDANFDFIDIDPFGSPVYFLSNVLLNARHNAIIGITATDLGTLCGRFGDACIRRYGTFSSKTDFDKEFGLRNLIGYIAREAAKYEVGIEILFSYYFMHYFKVYFRVKRSRSRTDETLKNLNFLLYCDISMSRKYIAFEDIGTENFCEQQQDEWGNKFKILGPIWSGKFADENVCDLLSKEVEEKTEQKILTLVKEEQNILVPYYDLHKFCKINHIQIKGTDDIIKITSFFKRSLKNPGTTVSGLRSEISKFDNFEIANENKFNAARTHFDGKGLRFNGDAKELLEILK
ncbi:MAG: hypothetical protein BWK75_00110 [Candidatus Altiarchaeales archaeon A3]|nr:MAG: hypothetical protein BWK75_00110 [Candidatus Altiarchaeales archaeon A3]